MVEFDRDRRKRRRVPACRASQSWVVGELVPTVAARVVGQFDLAAAKSLAYCDLRGRAVLREPVEFRGPCGAIRPDRFPIAPRQSAGCPPSRFRAARGSRSQAD